eukprot:GEMP01003863.1.p1 GENE.GEMP01003863.1~~GEMP01003863.1.p1  ORF type:complete len:924 (+),score=241.77 GEMP01003863.1:104-2875(+)
MASWFKRTFSRTPSPAKPPSFAPNVQSRRSGSPSGAETRASFSPSSRPRKPEVDYPVAQFPSTQSIQDESPTGDYDDSGGYDGARTLGTPVDVADSPYAQYKAKYLRSGKEESPPTRPKDIPQHMLPQPSPKHRLTPPKPAEVTRHRPSRRLTDETDSILRSLELGHEGRGRSEPPPVPGDPIDPEEVRAKKEKKEKKKKKERDGAATSPKMAGSSDPWASMAFPAAQMSQMQPPPPMMATIPPTMLNMANMAPMGQVMPLGNSIELREDQLPKSLLQQEPYDHISAMTPQFGVESDAMRPLRSPQPKPAQADPELMQEQLRQQALVMQGQMKNEMVECMADMGQLMRSQMQQQMQEQQRIQQNMQEQQRIQMQMQEQQGLQQRHMMQQIEQERDHFAVQTAAQAAGQTASVVRTASQRTRAASFGSQASSIDHTRTHDTMSMPSMPSMPFKPSRQSKRREEGKIIPPGTVTTFLPLPGPRNHASNGYNDGADDSPQFSLDALVVPSANELRNMRSPFQNSPFGGPPIPRSDSHARVLAALKGYDAHDIPRRRALEERDASDRGQRSLSPSQLSSAILRRVEGIEIKHQREREQMLAWKEQQEILNKKHDLQMQQLMRAVRSLIHISEASLDRADSPTRRTSSAGGNLDKVQDHLASVGCRLREARLMLHTNILHDPLKPKLNEQKMEQILLDAQSAVDAAMVETHTPPTAGDLHRPTPQAPVDTKSTRPAHIPTPSYPDTMAAQPPEVAHATPPIATPASSTIGPPTPVLVSPTMVPASPANASLTPVLDHAPARPPLPENGSSPVVPPSRPPPPTTPSPQDWSISEKEWNRYAVAFTRHSSSAGFIEASYLMALVTKSRVDRQTLLNILTLCDLDKDGKFTEIEFVLAMHMVTKVRAGFLVPSSLPAELKAVFDKKNAGAA